MFMHLHQRQRALQDGDLLPTPHHADNVGFVRISRHRVYRHISPGCRDGVLRLLASPLLDELMERRLFPGTGIASDAPGEGALVLEHEKAPFLLYPWEWTFSMLKDSCLSILDATDVCNKHGYRLHDTFIQNSVFFSGEPRYVDLGGLSEKSEERRGTSRSFFEYGYLPLALWSEGNFFMAQCLLREIFLSERLRPRTRIYNLPLFDAYVRPFIPQRRLVHRLKALLNMGLWQIPALRSKLFALPRFGRVDYTTAQMRGAIAALNRPARASAGERHHTLSPAQARIIHILAARSHERITIIGGGSGAFTKELARHIPHARLLSLDCDSDAADDHYLAVRAESLLKERITTGVANILYPNHRLLPLEARGRAELVLVRAPIHDLLFQQKADMTTLMDTLSAMADAYFAIEFNPRGAQRATREVLIPGWYTLDWFRDQLTPHFHVIREETLEADHVFFFCGKRDSAQA